MEKNDLYKIASTYTGEEKQAIESFKLDSKSTDVFYNKFLTLVDMGKIDEAETYARKAVDIDNTFYTVAILAAAQNCLTDENYDDAIIFLDLPIKLGFNTSDMWRSKAKALTMKKRFEEALICYDKATEINPRDNETLVERGLLFETLGRYEEAISILDLNHYSKQRLIPPDPHLHV